MFNCHNGSGIILKWTAAVNIRNYFSALEQGTLQGFQHGFQRSWSWEEHEKHGQDVLLVYDLCLRVTREDLGWVYLELCRPTHQFGIVGVWWILLNPGLEKSNIQTPSPLLSFSHTDTPRTGRGRNSYRWLLPAC